MAYIATSKNAVITFTSVLTGPPHVLEGFSSENILAIPDVDIIKSTMGCDGVINRAVVAKKVEGTFSFWSASPSVAFIYQVQQASYLAGFPVNGILNVFFTSLGVSFTYPDFCFESGPKGFEAADELKAVSIKWSSQLPNYASLGAVVTQLAGLVL
jgi:hypothetical protein